MNLRNSLFALAISSAALFAACGSSSSGAGSCTYSPSIPTYSYTFCYTYLGSGYTSSSAQSACTAEGSGSTYSSSACPTGSGGSCDVDHGTAAEYTFTISTDAGTTVSTQTECTTLGGTYTAGS